jgi:hypothetical protein
MEEAQRKGEYIHWQEAQKRAVIIATAPAFSEEDGLTMGEIEVALSPENVRAAYDTALGNGEKIDWEEAELRVLRDLRKTSSFTEGAALTIEGLAKQVDQLSASVRNFLSSEFPERVAEKLMAVKK